MALHWHFSVIKRALTTVWTCLCTLRNTMDEPACTPQNLSDSPHTCHSANDHWEFQASSSPATLFTTTDLETFAKLSIFGVGAEIALTTRLSQWPSPKGRGTLLISSLLFF